MKRDSIIHAFVKVGLEAEKYLIDRLEEYGDVGVAIPDGIISIMVDTEKQEFRAVKRICVDVVADENGIHDTLFVSFVDNYEEPEHPLMEYARLGLVDWVRLMFAVDNAIELEEQECANLEDELDN